MVRTTVWPFSDVEEESRVLEIDALATVRSSAANAAAWFQHSRCMLTCNNTGESVFVAESACKTCQPKLAAAIKDFKRKVQTIIDEERPQIRSRKCTDYDPFPDPLDRQKDDRACEAKRCKLTISLE